MLTQPSYAVNNVQGLATITKGQADAIKIVFDKAGADTKSYLIALLAELASTTGAENIGIPETIVGSGTTVKARADWLYTQLATITTEAVVDGSLGDVKLSTGATAILQRFANHLANNTEHIWFDKTTPTTSYKMVVISGKPYLEVVSV